MSNEDKILQFLGDIYESQTRVEQRIESLEKSQIRMEQRIEKMEKRMDSLDDGQAALSQSVAKIEHEQGTKIAALFDGYTLRGDQVERLCEHLDERLDVIQTDISYILGKVAQHDRNIVQLSKIAK